MPLDAPVTNAVLSLNSCIMVTPYRIRRLLPPVRMAATAHP